MFAQILSRYREKHKITQDQLVYNLSTNFDELKKLDCVTFSRWENGKTEPSLKKIFLVLTEIGYAEDYFNYLLTRDSFYRYPILDKLLDYNFSKNIDHKIRQYSQIYNYDISNINIKICRFNELPDKIKEIVLSSDCSDADKYDLFNIHCVYLLCDGKVIGYSLFNNIYFDCIKTRRYWDYNSTLDKSNGLVHFKQLCLTRDVWLILLLYHYLYLLNNIKHYSSTYTLNFENIFYSFFIKLGAYKVASFSFEHDNNEYDYSLMCMDSIDFLSNKNILGCVIETYRYLHDKNTNLLNDIINSIRG